MASSRRRFLTSAAAAALVRTGRTVSLSRVFEPPQHFMQKSSRGQDRGYVMDYLGFIYHGSVVTHIDALCHIWDGDGMWQGRDPDVESNSGWPCSTTPGSSRSPPPARKRAATSSCSCCCR